jgi:hypothetical protein
VPEKAASNDAPMKIEIALSSLPPHSFLSIISSSSVTGKQAGRETQLFNLFKDLGHIASGHPPPKGIS